jgi:hypothetical protein
MADDIKILRPLHGSAQADGNAEFGRVSFRLSRMPERRWLELFDVSKGDSFSTEERGNEFFLHVRCVPGEVAQKRDAAQLLITEINQRWSGEVERQRSVARERDDKKRSTEDALNRELEALHYEPS